MHNLLNFRGLFLLILAIWGSAGCHPSISEIPPIPNYIAHGRSWNTDAVCLVGMANNAEGQSQIASIILPLIRQELLSEGYRIETLDDDYMTREKRLSVQKIILFTGFDIKETLVKEGKCYDMKLTVDILSNPEQQHIANYEIWGRAVLSRGETRQWADVYRECVNNLPKVAGFREALEVNTR